MTNILRTYRVAPASTWMEVVVRPHERGECKSKEHVMSNSGFSNRPIQYFNALLESLPDDQIYSHPEDLLTCQHALSAIEYLYSLLLIPSPTCYSSIWQGRTMIPANMSPAFTLLLRRRHPRALAIWSLFVVLESLANFREIRWICGKIERKIEALKSGAPEGWEWAFKWQGSIVMGKADVIECFEKPIRRR